MNASFFRRHWALTLLIVFMLSVGSLLAMSDVLYQRTLGNVRAHHTLQPFPACHKVWGHRGYAIGHRENSLDSVSAAFSLGATGVEFDILYDEALDDFVVSHDRPYATFDGKLLMLDAMLAAHAAKGYFWLDAKDLGKLSLTQARRATTRLSALIKKHDLTQRAFVESRNPLYLRWLTHDGIFTSYMVSPNPKKYGPITYWITSAVNKLGYAFIGGGAISMSDYRYTEKTQKTFGAAPILLSTINDPAVIQGLINIPSINVVLTDENHFNLSACANKNGQRGQ